MITKFEAEKLVEELVAESDPPYLQVFVADATGSHYLVLQRSQPFGVPEDCGVYVEVDDQSMSGYECIESCELTPDHLLVRTTKPLGLSKAVEVIEAAFTGRHRPSPQLVARLRAIFTGREDRLRVVGCE
jgi:hypothetical protein